MVVDSSALAAILTGAPERGVFTDLILGTTPVLVSATSLVELGIILKARRQDHAPDVLDEFLSQLRIEIRPFEAGHAAHARSAFERFGAGRHPAGLNFADCLVYALAKVQDDTLLFSGDRFASTDLLPAWRPEAMPLREPESDNGEGA